MNSDDVLRDYLEQVSTGDAMPPGARRVRRLLGSPSSWEEPPAATLDGIMAQIATERAGGRQQPVNAAAVQPPGHVDAGAPQAPSTNSRGNVTDITSAAPRRRTARRTLLAAAAAAVFVAGGGAAGWYANMEHERRGVPVAMSGTELSPGASAIARVRDTPSGFAVRLRISGLPPAAQGTYYQAWLKSPDGELVTIGTFHLHRDDEDVDLWSGVDPTDYPLLTVTLQQEHGGQPSSGKVVLKGTIPAINK